MNKREENIARKFCWLGLIFGIFSGFFFTRLYYLSKIRSFSSPSSESMEQRNIAAPAFLMKVTAYCPCEKCCGKWADGYTASGYKIQLGDKFVAAPKHIPFGTMIEIPDYGTVPVRDRGGAITTSKLDVYFDTHQEALDWGVKYLEVKIR